jgi:hypothetical protein
MQLLRLALCSAVGGAFPLAALVSVAGAQDQAWIRQLGTSAPDSAQAVASDGSLGVYVSGNTFSGLGGAYFGAHDAWVARYDSAGNRTWIRQFGTPAEESTSAAMPDGNGGTWLCGSTGGSLFEPSAGGQDYWLARFDGSGGRVAERQRGTGGFDSANALAPNVGANFGSYTFFVGGDTSGSLGGPNAGGQDAWLVRTDSSLSLIWSRQLGTVFEETLNAAATDGVGGVYVCGGTGGNLGGPTAGGQDGWLARYDVQGNRTWIRQFGTVGRDEVRAATPDGSSGVYSCGETDGDLGAPNAGGQDVWLARHDSAGDLAWLRQLGTAGTDFASAVASDGAGGVYVTGATAGSLGGAHAGGQDVWLAHFDGAGDRTWIVQLGSSNDDHAHAAAGFGPGGVFVAGWTGGGLGEPNAGSYDAWLARYDTEPAVTRHCTPAIPNSTGQAGWLVASGSSIASANDLTLAAAGLPQEAFGFFLTSRDQGSIYPVGNSQGRLCLGGQIGRYVEPGQIKNSGATGSFSLALDLTAMAHPISPVAVIPGQTWYFQAWYRDANPMSTSNFTDGLGITFW